MGAVRPGAGAPLSRRRLRLELLQIAQEVAVGREDHGGAFAERPAVGLQGAHELVELDVAAVGIGEDLDRQRVSLAARDLRPLARFLKFLGLRGIAALDGLQLRSPGLCELLLREDFSLLGLVIALISDLAYMWVDPRLDFESREI